MLCLVVSLCRHFLLLDWSNDRVPWQTRTMLRLSVRQVSLNLIKLVLKNNTVDTASQRHNSVLGHFYKFTSTTKTAAVHCQKGFDCVVWHLAGSHYGTWNVSIDTKSFSVMTTVIRCVWFVQSFCFGDSISCRLWLPYKPLMCQLSWEILRWSCNVSWSPNPTEWLNQADSNWAHSTKKTEWVVFFWHHSFPSLLVVFEFLKEIQVSKDVKPGRYTGLSYLDVSLVHFYSSNWMFILWKQIEFRWNNFWAIVGIIRVQLDTYINTKTCLFTRKNQLNRPNLSVTKILLVLGEREWQRNSGLIRTGHDARDEAN